jgi:HK97 family phage portal protein
MPIISRMAERRALVVNPLHPRDPVLAEWFGGSDTASGETVTPTTAMHEATVLSCVRYIGETMASLSLLLYLLDQQDPRKKARATARPLYHRLHEQPNRFQSSFEWIDMLMQHVLLRGNFYNELVPSTDLPPFEIVPLHPDRVRPFWAPDGQRAYKYTPPPPLPPRVILQNEMFHLPFMPNDGLTGVSVITHSRETIGRALAASKYGSATFKNGGRPGGVLTHPSKLSPGTKANLREDWQTNQGGAVNAGKTAILQEGMKYEPITLSPADAEWIATMGFNAKDVARIFKVPPHKVGIMDDATFTNIEHQGIEAVVDCIRPWAVRFEQRAALDLLTPAERRQYVPEFLLDALLRGDTETRWKAHATAFGIGAKSQNDILHEENEPPIEGGDVHYIPLNMTPATADGMSPSQRAEMASALVRAGYDPIDAAAAAGLPAMRHLGLPPVTLIQLPDGPAGGGGGGSGSGGGAGATAGRTVILGRERRAADRLVQLRGAFQPLFEDAARRVLRREADQVERQFRKMAQQAAPRSTRSLADFETWQQDFYRTFDGAAAAGLAPVATSYAQAVRSAAVDLVDGADPDAVDLTAFVAAYAGAYGARHAGESRSELTAVLAAAAAALPADQPDELMSGMDALLANWRDERPASVAAHETIQAGGAFSRESWRQSGVTKLVWNSAGGCPLCENLSGQIVGIEETFANAGDGIAGATGQTPLTASKTLHPPLHKGCDCTIGPA